MVLIGGRGGAYAVLGVSLSVRLFGLAGSEVARPPRSEFPEGVEAVTSGGGDREHLTQPITR